MIFAVVLCLLASIHASTSTLTDVKDRLKGRVVHIEWLEDRGRWLWQTDHYDTDGNKYMKVDKINERDTYYTPVVQYQVTECGEGTTKYLCLESLSLRNYYLSAGYVPGDDIKVPKLEYDTYIDNDKRYHWKVQCEGGNLDKCKLESVRFENVFLAVDHYNYATLVRGDNDKAWFRVHAPNPSDGYNEVLPIENTGANTIHGAKRSVTIGVSQTQSSSFTITKTTSTEIGGAFKAFSFSASSSIEETWQIEKSTTYEAEKSVEITLTLPPRTKVVLNQLVGKYTDQFSVQADKYIIDEIPLDTRSERRRYAAVPVIIDGVRHFEIGAPVDRSKTEL